MQAPVGVGCVGVEFQAAGARAPRQQGQDGRLKVAAAPPLHDKTPVGPKQTPIVGLAVGALAENEGPQRSSAQGLDSIG